MWGREEVKSVWSCSKLLSWMISIHKPSENIRLIKKNNIIFVSEESESTPLILTIFFLLHAKSPFTLENHEDNDLGPTTTRDFDKVISLILH